MKAINIIKVLSLFGLLFTISSCTDDSLEPNNEGPKLKSITNQNIDYCGQETVVNFMAGQNIIAGNITVGNDETNLYVTYNTTGGWYMSATHLYVGASELLPVNKAGNPAPGQFPLKTTHSPYVTSFTYTIPLSQLPSIVTVAAHADVKKLDANNNVIQAETAWGFGEKIGKQWAMKFNYTVQECIVEPPVENCYQTETAWASGTKYVQRGSWATYSTYSANSPITIYAGQNINVGTATFSGVDANGNVTLTINLINGWELQPVAESVKIQGYNTIPLAENPQIGLFNTYKGTSLTVTMPYFLYYGIHLDVRKVVPCL